MELKQLSNQIYYNLKLSQYGKEKEFITKCFQNHLENQFYTVKLRLHVIDSLYSTQMNKRYYGIEELAESIAQYSDEILIEEAQKVLIGKYSEILEALFSNKYGYNSIAQKQKKAVSLISKYLYFLTDYQFPIYDSLVKIAYPKVILQYNLKTEYLKITDANFLKALSHLNEVSGINNFEKLDNYLWYSQKVANKSYSLIYSKEDHLSMIRIKN
ncbi:hypothetical protein J3D55_003608 [Chryseobacterium ginsenosidimutans]|uniref:hypothetical protein n=1 Tax=Chryseobacterium ginsenosidimutans TaxID=687846 RepID=UPI002169D1E5|nr:hypothetical protein [Chryseobacterium ginsenosidimutans]MCS3870692.1 hypothetical protein [Chryseobacterium ginsenosidimutans]